MDDQIKARQKTYNAKTRHLKIKFKMALESKDFCCVCLNCDDYLLSVDTKNHFEHYDGMEALTVREIFYSLMKNEAKIYSDSVCAKCKAQIIELYSFISTTRRTWCIVDDFIDQCTNKIQDLDTTLENLKNEEFKSVIVLNDPCINKIKMENTAVKIKNVILCNHCEKTYTSKLSLIKHLNTRHSDEVQRRMECPECKEDCVHKKYLEAMKINSKNKVLPCVDCDYKCYTKHQLILHVNRDHLDLIQSTCEVCSIPFYTKTCRIKHMIKYHTDDFKCTNCSKKFSSEKAMAKHVEKDNCIPKPFCCTECSKTFDSVEKLESHLNSHRGLFVCDVCKKTLKNRISLELHLARHNGIIKKPNLTCYICLLEFTSMRQYRLHNKEHAEEKPSCKDCNKTFDNYLKYNSHVKSAHFGKRLKCEFCDYIGKNENMLDAHLNRHHLKIAPYQCDICQKRFTGDNLLQNHMKTHVPNENKGFKCRECNKHFCSSGSLKKHMRQHFGKNGDQVTCEICAGNFVCLSALLEHRARKHGGEKTFKCPLCEIAFSSILQMRTHVRRVHWKSKEKFDCRKLEGLKPEHYELFRDKRNLIVEEAVVENCIMDNNVNIET